MAAVASERAGEYRSRLAAGLPLSAQANDVLDWMQSDAFAPHPVIDIGAKPLVLNLGRGDGALADDLHEADVGRLTALIARAMDGAGTTVAFGRWGEQRGLYNNAHFAAGAANPRTVHLGVDVFCQAGTDVRAPLDAVVELVANNARPLDYGPLVVLGHRGPQDQAFYTLYGHLSLASTAPLAAGQAIAAGEPFAAVGDVAENGNWPPHLHFQVMLDLLDLGAEFPGVSSVAEQAFWLALSPSPAAFFSDVDAAALDGRRFDLAESTGRDDGAAADTKR